LPREQEADNGWQIKGSEIRTAMYLY